MLLEPGEGAGDAWIGYAGRMLGAGFAWVKVWHLSSSFPRSGQQCSRKEVALKRVGLTLLAMLLFGAGVACWVTREPAHTGDAPPQPQVKSRPRDVTTPANVQNAASIAPATVAATSGSPANSVATRDDYA